MVPIKGKTFRIKSFEEVKEDIDEVSSYGCGFEESFWPMGMRLIIPQKELLRILDYLKMKLKGLERVGIYANARDILRKDVEELKALKDLGLGIIYLGLESGNREVLKRIKKNATVDQLIRAGKRVKESGILLSVTVILGIGGVEWSQAHAEDTGKVLSEMDPDYVGALSLMVVPGTPIEKRDRDREIGPAHSFWSDPRTGDDDQELSIYPVFFCFQPRLQLSSPPDSDARGEGRGP